MRKMFSEEQLAQFGGGTKLYKHDIFVNEDGANREIFVITTTKEKVSTVAEFKTLICDAIKLQNPSTGDQMIYANNGVCYSFQNGMFNQDLWWSDVTEVYSDQVIDL